MKKLGRPNRERFYLHRQYLNFQWDQLVLEGKSPAPVRLAGRPLVDLELHTADIKGVHDLDMLRGLLLVQELGSFWPGSSLGFTHRQNLKAKKKSYPGGKSKSSRQFHSFTVSSDNLTGGFLYLQFILDRFLPYLRRKQLPWSIHQNPGNFFTISLPEISLLLSGPSALYLVQDYFDWENPRLNLRVSVRDAPFRQFCTALKILP